MSTTDDPALAAMEQLELGARHPQIILNERRVLMSIAISMKRIADVLEGLDQGSEQGRNFAEKIYYAIYNPITEAMAQWARHR